MQKSEIIQTLKENYKRDLRKQVVKTILAEEKANVQPNYEIINQIFAYVLKEFNWEGTVDLEDWDNAPLYIMETVFPKIETTKWFAIQILTAKKMIEEAEKTQTK